MACIQSTSNFYLAITLFLTLVTYREVGIGAFLDHSDNTYGVSQNNYAPFVWLLRWSCRLNYLDFYTVA